MKIYNLEKMEEIVLGNSSLHWDGWNVVYLEKDDNSRMKKQAAFLDSQWHKKIVYENIDGSWEIPDNILRKGSVQI